MKHPYTPVSVEVICLSACDVITASGPDWDLGEPDSD